MSPLRLLLAVVVVATTLGWPAASAAPSGPSAGPPATAGLWAWYGTTVFFEILRAGWMACF